VYNIGMTTTEHSTAKHGLQPHEVRSNLTKRIEKILADSLHNFEELEQELDERHFDVDGILSGRPSREQRSSIRRSAPVRAHRYANTVSDNPYALTRPNRGSFIPASHFTRFA
jgi:hypothetical protein